MAITKATMTYAPNFNDEDNPVIKYDNSAGKKVTSLQACISLDGSKDDIAYRNISKTGTSYTFNLTNAERKVLRQATTGSNKREVKFIIKTVINGNTYTDSKTKTLKIVNCQPTISPDLYDSNEKTVALTGDNRTLVKYYSNVYYAFNWTTKKEATMSTCKFTCGNKSAYATGTGTVEAVEGGGYEFSATDSRGNTVTAVGSLMFVNYVKLTCNLSVETPTTEGITNLTVNGNYYNGIFGKENNNLEIYYRYKEDNGSYGDWVLSETTATIKNNTYTANIPVEGLDYKKKYTFQAKVKDQLDEKKSKERVVKTIPVFDWGAEDFNFNVPVNFSDTANFNTTVTAGGYNLAGLAKAMSNSYNLTAKVTWTNTDYSASSVSAVLVGNELRIGFSATRSTSTGTGNIDNEIICSIEVTHNGKITKAFDVSFASGGTGAVSTFNAASVTVADTYLTFDIQLNATTIATKNFGSYFTIPVALNLNAY